MQLKNYTVVSSVDDSGDEPAGNEILVLTGAAKGTIVKTLELVAGETPAVVNVIRKNASDVEYVNIKVDMVANNYVVLWDGFVVIPAGHKLLIKAAANDLVCVANAVEM